MGTGVVFDPEYGVWAQNESDVATFDVLRALHNASPEMAALVRWSSQTQRPTGRRGSLFDRDFYVLPGNVYEQMRVAYSAVATDDVVAGVAETTESLAFSRMSFYAEDEDEQDVWNQIAADLDLDARLREMWREMFTVSQVVVAIWWGRRNYKVRGRTKDGIRRKREFRNLLVPTAMAVLDPLKIVPVGNPVFGSEQLAWIADRGEAEAFDAALTSRTGLDPLVERLIVGRYEPVTQAERKYLVELGVDVNNLFLLNPASVFRHTATKPGYQRFANVRLASCFELLDLKQQLKEMDRAHLLGGTNFIVLIRKGTDALPAKPAEVTNLQAQVRTVARLPVLVGDHRLDVQIITPKLDTTLHAERYDTIDDRLKARLFQMFASGSRNGNRDDSTKLVKMVARGMESRRHMIRRALEAAVFRPIVAQNEAFTGHPTLRYHPAQISLSFDSDFASFLLELRASNEISRETILSQFDLDQDDEAGYREREEETYDDIFKTQVPFSAPNPAGPEPQDPRQAGRTQGGKRNGGGAAPGSGQGQAPRRPRRTSD